MPLPFMPSKNPNVYGLCMALALVLISSAGHADNFTHGVQQRFDWQTRWGAINFGQGDDPVIPSTQIQPKADIKRVVSTCGTQTTDLSSLNVSSIDVNQDGKTDYIIDGNGYFPQYFNAATCPMTLCTPADGCYASIYLTSEPTNLITTPAETDATCPATAEANTSCLPYCAATAETCPNLFRYNTTTVFNKQVKAWNFISSADFQTFTTGLTLYQMRNVRPVLVALMNNTHCYAEEMAANNNQCVKYFQFDDSVGTGAFVDLYTYNSFSIGEDDARFTYAPYDRAHAHLARGMVMGTGFAHTLEGEGTVDLQIPNFTRTDSQGHVTQQTLGGYHIENHTQTSYFIPTNTDSEFSSFLNNPPQGVTIADLSLRFTDWIGDTQCPSGITVGQTVTIAAQRFCQRSSSAYASCQECITAHVPGWEQGCTLQQTCQGDTCTFNESPADRYIGSAALKVWDGKPTTLKECLDGTGVWAVLYVSNGFGAPNAVLEYGGCMGAFNHLCEQGNFCLAEATKITMADGSLKSVNTIRPGERVMGFHKTLGILKPAKVTIATITQKQPILRINNKLELTPNHYIVTASGAKVRADKLKVGDKLARANGKSLIITSIVKGKEPVTVYNLELENHLGFIANGVRVTGYQP